MTMSKQARVLHHKKEENRYPSKSISVLKDNTDASVSDIISNTTGVVNNSSDSDTVATVAEFESAVASLSSKINEILVVLKESRIIK
jgi:hypothetical protein